MEAVLQCHRGGMAYGRGRDPLARRCGVSKVHYKPIWPLEKRSRRGFRGYPMATVAFYGPDDHRATKVAVGILKREGDEPDPLERWFSEEIDVRSDAALAERIGEFIERHGAKSVTLADRIIG